METHFASRGGGAIVTGYYRDSTRFSVICSFIPQIDSGEERNITHPKEITCCGICN